MPIIHLSIDIQAPREVVFDLARSVEIHEKSTKKTNEKALTGKTSGLMNLNDTVTWRAKHFGVYQKLSVKITALKKPNYFVDEMISGIFKSFRHEHHFTQVGKTTTMEDIFNYQSPLGRIGKIADWLFLKRYMTNFLNTRNFTIKEIAESEQ